MKKSIFLAIVLAFIAMTSISAYAAIDFEFVLEDASEEYMEGVYRIAAYGNDTDIVYDTALGEEITGNFRGLKTIITYDPTIICPFDADGGEDLVDMTSEPELAFLPLYLTRTKSASFASVSAEEVEDKVSVQLDMFYAPSKKSNYIYLTGKDPEDPVPVLSFYFMFADGMSEADFAYDSFTVEYLQYANCVNNYFGSEDAAKNNVTVTVLEGVLPEGGEEEPAAPTIAVKAGDVIYYEDGTSVVVDADNDAYELDATKGETVYVNYGYGSYKVYTIADGVATESEDNKDVVVSSAATSVVRNKETLEAGVLFTADFVAGVATEYGFIGSVRNANGIGEDELTMDAVEAGKAVKDTVEVEADATLKAFVSGIPADAEATLVVRPYFVINGITVYGEAVETTIAAGWSAAVDAE